MFETKVLGIAEEFPSDKVNNVITALLLLKTNKSFDIIWHNDQK